MRPSAGRPATAHPPAARRRPDAGAACCPSRCSSMDQQVCPAHRRRDHAEEHLLNVSIRDVAERAGVSVGTVSNVLNRPEAVGTGTRERVLAAIEALGFVRNESARQLRAGRSRTLGLVVLDIANPFFTDVARGVEDVANAAGLAVILCNSDDRAAKEAAHLDVLTEQRVQGVLITPTAELSRHVEALRSRGT